MKRDSKSKECDIWVGWCIVIQRTSSTKPEELPVFFKFWRAFYSFNLCQRLTTSKAAVCVACDSYVYFFIIITINRITLLHLGHFIMSSSVLLQTELLSVPTQWVIFDCSPQSRWADVVPSDIPLLSVIKVSCQPTNSNLDEVDTSDETTNVHKKYYIAQRPTVLNRFLQLFEQGHVTCMYLYTLSLTLMQDFKWN